MEVVLKDRTAHPLHASRDGYFSAAISGLRTGTLYKFRIDDSELLPDPASRFQPEGPHGWSEVIDPCSYVWSSNEKNWKGYDLRGQVIYEIHIGTFTPEGTYRSAEDEFARLRALGITVLEIMPLHDFVGSYGWGYDGVDFFAPFHAYGSPDELRHMIDVAHQHGLAVLLDVVYNHFGPDGNYLPCFSPYYLSKEPTEWGDSPNFDGEQSGPVREFFLQNVEYWIREFHFDGLRFDATQSIKDDGAHGEHILAAMVRRARAATAGRKLILISECERQQSIQILPPQEGGYGLDGMWNDDLHHSIVVRLTGKREAYYVDHPGRAQEFVSAAKYGFLFQGQFYSWQKANRGTPFPKMQPWQAITFIENHDQVANTLHGTRPRQHASDRAYRAMAGYWLLAPGTPMFFMGQEYGSTRRFVYVCDQKKEICDSVRKGRVEFLNQFESIRSIENAINVIANPSSRETFDSCRLQAADRESKEAVQLQTMFRDLLRLRREDQVIAKQERGAVDGAVLSDDCFVLRYFNEGDDRLLIVNFGPLLMLEHLPEPLLAPPAGTTWTMEWSSEAVEYGGSVATFPICDSGWHIAECCTLLLTAGRKD